MAVYLVDLTLQLESVRTFLVTKIRRERRSFQHGNALHSMGRERRSLPSGDCEEGSPRYSVTGAVCGAIEELESCECVEGMANDGQGYGWLCMAAGLEGEVVTVVPEAGSSCNINDSKVSVTAPSCNSSKLQFDRPPLSNPNPNPQSVSDRHRATQASWNSTSLE
jgi:hypothetical protein